jgi:hypothetical protein
MLYYVQMTLPLLTVGLATAICLSIVSFIVAQPKPHPCASLRPYRKPRSGDRLKE